MKKIQTPRGVPGRLPVRTLASPAAMSSRHRRNVRQEYISRVSVQQILTAYDLIAKRTGGRYYREALHCLVRIVKILNRHKAARSSLFIRFKSLTNSLQQCEIKMFQKTKKYLFFKRDKEKILIRY
jgi:hypothetical protein